jgi:hypothetical protein
VKPYLRANYCGSAWTPTSDRDRKWETLRKQRVTSDWPSAQQSFFHFPQPRLDKAARRRTLRISGPPKHMSGNPTTTFMNAFIENCEVWQVYDAVCHRLKAEALANSPIREKML